MHSTLPTTLNDTVPMENDTKIEADVASGNFTAAGATAEDNLPAATGHGVRVSIGAACNSFHMCQSDAYNRKCVVVPEELSCAHDAGNMGKRLNMDWPSATDAFEITTPRGNPHLVCARRTDYHGGWQLNLEVQCYKRRTECLEITIPTELVPHHDGNINPWKVAGVYTWSSAQERFIKPGSPVWTSWNPRLHIGCCRSSNTWTITPDADNACNEWMTIDGGCIDDSDRMSIGSSSFRKWDGTLLGSRLGHCSNQHR